MTSPYGQPAVCISPYLAATPQYESPDYVPAQYYAYSFGAPLPPPPPPGFMLPFAPATSARQRGPPPQSPGGPQQFALPYGYGYGMASPYASLLPLSPLTYPGEEEEEEEEGRSPRSPARPATAREPFRHRRARSASAISRTARARRLTRSSAHFPSARHGTSTASRPGTRASASPTRREEPSETTPRQAREGVTQSQVRLPAPRPEWGAIHFPRKAKFDPYAPKKKKEKAVWTEASAERLTKPKEPKQPDQKKWEEIFTFKPSLSEKSQELAAGKGSWQKRREAYIENWVKELQSGPRQPDKTVFTFQPTIYRKPGDSGPQGSFLRRYENYVRDWKQQQEERPLDKNIYTFQPKLSEGQAEKRSPELQKPFLQRIGDYQRRREEELKRMQKEQEAKEREAASLFRVDDKTRKQFQEVFSGDQSSFVERMMQDAKQREEQAREDATKPLYSFTPRLKSRSPSASVSPARRGSFLERMEKHQQDREARLEFERRRKQEEEERALTFSPDLTATRGKPATPRPLGQEESQGSLASPSPSSSRAGEARSPAASYPDSANSPAAAITPASRPANAAPPPAPSASPAPPSAPDTRSDAAKALARKRLQEMRAQAQQAAVGS